MALQTIVVIHYKTYYGYTRRSLGNTPLQKIELQCTHVKHRACRTYRPSLNECRTADSRTSSSTKSISLAPAYSARQAMPRLACTTAPSLPVSCWTLLPTPSVVSRLQVTARFVLKSAISILTKQQNDERALTRSASSGVDRRGTTPTRVARRS